MRTITPAKMYKNWQLIKITYALMIMVLILPGSNVKGQNQAKLDSLLNLLRTSQVDSSTIKINIELGLLYRNPSPQTSSAYLKNALILADKIRDHKQMANSTYLLGANNLNLGLLDEAEVKFVEALGYYKKINDEEKIARIMNYFGRVACRRREFKKALEHHNEAMNIGIKIKNKKLIATIYNSIGIVYWESGELEKALDEFKKSLEIRLELDHRRGVGQCYNNIGLIYYDLKAYNNALEHYLKALEIAEETENMSLVITAHCNLGEIYALLGDFKNSEKYYERGMQYATETQVLDRQAIIYIYMSESFILQKKYKESVNAGLSGLKIAKEINNLGYQIKALKNLVKVNELSDNYKEALAFHRNFRELSDQNLIHTNEIKTKELQNKFEVLKKKDEEKLLSKEKELSQIEVAYYSKLRNLIVVVSVIILTLVILMFIKLQSRTKRKIAVDNSC